MRSGGLDDGRLPLLRKRPNSLHLANKLVDTNFLSTSHVAEGGIIDKPMQGFRLMVEQMRAYPDEPMTMEEIQAIVNEVRAERRARRESSR